jgi:hypothetical protein
MNVAKCNDLRYIISHLPGWNNLNIWVKPQQIKITFVYEIRSIFNSENACYHSVLNPLSSSLLFKNTKTSVYRTTIVTFV